MTFRFPDGMMEGFADPWSVLACPDRTPPLATKRGIPVGTAIGGPVFPGAVREADDADSLPAARQVN